MPILRGYRSLAPELHHDVLKLEHPQVQASADDRLAKILAGPTDSGADQSPVSSPAINPFLYGIEAEKTSTTLYHSGGFPMRNQAQSPTECDSMACRGYLVPRGHSILMIKSGKLRRMHLFVRFGVYVVVHILVSQRRRNQFCRRESEQQHCVVQKREN